MTRRQQRNNPRQRRQHRTRAEAAAAVPATPRPELAPRPEHWREDYAAHLIASGVDPAVAEKLVQDVLTERDKLETWDRLYGPKRKKFSAARARQKGQHDAADQPTDAPAHESGGSPDGRPAE